MAGCTGPAGPGGTDGADGAPGGDGLSTLVRIDAVAPASCPTGGRTIHVGIDDDRDGVLDDDEIDSSLPACDIREPLVEARRVDPGPACSVGGLATRLGYDDDDDGLLDTDEVTQEQVVCEPPLPAVLALTPTEGRPGCDVARFNVNGGTLAWSAPGVTVFCAVAAAPWGSVYLGGREVEERDATTGELLGVFAATGVPLVDAARRRLYVNEGDGLVAFDLLTREALGAVTFEGGDRRFGGGLVLSDDGSRLIVVVANSGDGRIHLHDIDPTGPTSRGSLALEPNKGVSALFFFDDTLAIWDDFVDEFRVYGGAPLVEDTGRRVSLGADGRLSRFATAVRDPDEAVVYVASPTSSSLRRFELALLPSVSSLDVGDTMQTLLMADDGSRITAFGEVFAFSDILLPSGIAATCPLSDVALPAPPHSLHHVQVAR